MPNVAELIKDHVTLTVDCVDRLYLNAYVPRLQSEGGVVGFLRQRGQYIPSPALFGRITEAFRVGLRAWCQAQSIPWVESKKGERKDDMVQPYLERFTAAEGVILVGVAQERATSWTATKQVQGGRVHFTYRPRTVSVNHYYFYVLDAEWGPAFLKVCSYVPFTMKLCLNGHEWAKRQLTRQGVPFQALENGFLQCADATALKAIADALSPREIETFFQRWLDRLPLPLTVADHAAGFGYRLSILQMEVSRTQVFDRPLRGREFCEEVIRDNLDLGRPTRVQLLFDRRITHRTPEGQPAPGLKFGQPRVTALLQALCLFALTPEGITNQRLRPLVVQLLALPDAQYTARQMGYDLRRLARKGLIRRVPGKLCYVLTPYGRRVALFLSKVHARVLRPALQALDLHTASEAPPPLRKAAQSFDAATDALIQKARLAV